VRGGEVRGAWLYVAGCEAMTPLSMTYPTPLRRGQLWGQLQDVNFQFTCNINSFRRLFGSRLALRTKRMTQLPGKVGVRVLDHFVLIAVAQLAMQIRVVRLIRGGNLLFDRPFTYIAIGIRLLGHVVER
jgi:hypothetical protein